MQSLLETFESLSGVGIENVIPLGWIAKMGGPALILNFTPCNKIDCCDETNVF